METSIVRRPTSFRLRTDLIDDLKRNARVRKMSLNSYVEDMLLDIVYHEPNAVTKAAIEEAMNRKEYPAENLYDDVDEMFKTLDAEE